MGNRSRILVFCALLLPLACWWTSSAQAAEVVLVRSTASSRAAKLYQKAIDGFTLAFGKSPEIFAMEGDLRDPARLAEAIQREKPKVIVAIGPNAAKAVRKHLSDTPTIFCMVSQASQARMSGPNTTGVTMQPTPGQQFEAFRKVLPKRKNLGVIYHPKLSGPFLKAARPAASAAGLTLVERATEENKEVFEALKEILPKIDSLWLLRDGKVVTQEFFNLSLQIQAEKKIPLFVFSERFVAKGALCSYSADYASQGKQAARIAKAILSGTPAGEIPIQAPDGTLVINVATAAKLGIPISAELVSKPNVKTVGK